MATLIRFFCCLLLIACPGLASDDDRPQVASVSTVVPIGSQGTRAPGSLTTIFASNNGYAGNTFDITPTRSLQITGIDVNGEPAGATTNIDVYYLVGTSVGNENNAAAWTLLASGTGVCAGVDLPTFIDLPGAAGINFDARITYGIYVDFPGYPSLRCNYTNGQNTYSNSDLSLTTNTGQTTPAFTSSFFPREWNGTIYYDDGGPDLPRVDIKCNGGDAGVTMIAGTNAKVDYDFHAGTGAGFNVDLWLVLSHPFGFFTYDGLGPFLGWNLGFGSAFYTGPLTEMSGTCLDVALGIGSYKAFAGIDANANGLLNLPMFAMDSVDFDVLSPPRVYKWDDGTVENLLGWTSGGEICWLNGWTAYPGGNTILDVQCIFGAAMNPGLAPGDGKPCTLYVWNDPTNDSDPSDAVLVATEPAVVAQVDTDIYNVYPLTTPPTIAGVFFVGCNMSHTLPKIFCMPMDQTGTYVPGASWYCGTNTPPFDPNNLMNNQYTPAEYGVFNCIRAGW